MHFAGDAVHTPSHHITELFQYMRVGDLSENEKQQLIGRLEGESQAIRLEFATLVHTTEAELQLRNVPPKTLVHKLSFYDASLTKEFGEAETIEEVFSLANDYWSFFNYDLLEYIIKTFMLTSPMVEQYIANFKEYSNRRLCECKNDIAGSHNESGRRVVMKIDDKMNVQWTTLQEVRRLQDQVSRVVGVKVTQLLTVEGGCLYLVYRLPHKSIRTINFLSAEQKQELKDIGVLSIACERKVVRWQMKSAEFKRSIATRKKNIFTKAVSITELADYKTDVKLTLGVSNDQIRVKVDTTATPSESGAPGQSDVLVLTVIPALHHNSQAHALPLQRMQTPLNSFETANVMSTHDVETANADMFEFYMELYIDNRPVKKTPLIPTLRVRSNSAQGASPSTGLKDSESKQHRNSFPSIKYLRCLSSPEELQDGPASLPISPKKMIAQR